MSKKISVFKKITALLLVVIVNALVLCAPLSLSATGSALTNTSLVNGNFEDGTIGWSVTGTGATFKAVSEVQNSNHKDVKITGKAGYFETKDINTWLYQGVKLSAGKYTWDFHIDLYGTHNMVGAYTSLDGIGKGSNLIVADEFKATNDAGVVSSSFKKDTNDYRISCGKGNYHYTVSYTFTLSETTDVYFAIRGNGGACQYIDNMSVFKAYGKEIINGDFESGNLNGWETSGNSLKAVNSKVQESDSTTFSGYAAYLSNKEYLNQGLTLDAGDYKLSFDADVMATGDYSLIFGVYTELKNGGGYASGTAIGTAEGINKATGTKTAAVKDAGNNNGYYISSGKANFNFKISYSFTLSEKTTVFISMRSGNGTAYIDNLQFESGEPTYGSSIINGDFETGTLEGYQTAGKAIKVVEAKQDSNDDVTFTGKAAYLPNNTEYLNQGLTLYAGDYKLSFDADVMATGDYSLIFGVYTELKNGGGYGSGTAIGTAEGINKSTGTKTSAIKDAGNNNGYYISSGKANLNFKIEYNFTLTEKTTVHFSTRVGNGRAYIDNIKLVNLTQQENGIGFEDQNIGIVEFVQDGSFKNAAKIDNSESNSGDYSLKSTATLDKATNGGVAEGSRFNIPLNVEKNKYYKMTFWIKFDGTNKDDLVGFRVSNKVDATYKASLISGLGSINDDAYVTASDDSVKFQHSKWCGYINVFNNASGKWVKVTANFSTSENEKVYLGFTNFNRIGTTFWLDDISLEETTNPGPAGFDYTFESGSLNGIEFVQPGSFANSVVIDETIAKGGTKSLKSTATLDKATNGGTAESSRFDIPINVEKNKYYRLSFWIRFKGQNKDDYIGFRVSNSLTPSYKSSIISNQYVIGETANIISSDKNAIFRHSGWCGYINLFNTGNEEWVKYSVDFASADNEKLYLGFTNFARIGIVFNLDDIELSEISELTYPPKAEYDDEDIIYYISFDNEKENPVQTDGTPQKHYTKTSEQAHSGKYSIKWDPNHTDGWNYLYCTDKVGNIAYDPKLEPKTAYRFSFWMKSVGNLSRANVSTQRPGQDFSAHYPSSGDWELVTVDFITGAEETNYPIQMCVSYLRIAGTYTYIDDIKLEKLHPSVLKDNIDGLYCEEFFNKIPNGNFEYSLDGTVWKSADINLSRTKGNAEQGNYFAHISGNANLQFRIKLVSGYNYNFAYSYRMNKASNLKIGILDGSKNILPAAKGSGISTNSILTPSNSDGEWHRVGYTFLTPSDGYVYFMLSGTNLDIDLDEIACFKAPLSYTEDPNTYDQLSDASSSPKTGDEFPLKALLLIFDLSVLATVVIAKYLFKNNFKRSQVK